MPPVGRRAAARLVERIADSAGETAHVVAHAVERVAQSPRVPRVHGRGRERDRELAAGRREVRAKLGHAIELIGRVPVLRRDRTGARHDVHRVDEHRTAVLARQREARRRRDVQVDEPRLIHVPRVGRGDGRRQAVVEHRARPLERRPKASLRRVVRREQRHVRAGVGERRADPPVEALAGDRGWIVGVRAPIRNGRRVADARHLLLSAL